MTRRASIVNERNVKWAEHSRGEKFGYRRKSLSSAAGGEKLGCSLYEVPPGRRAWPYHYHGANEEAIYVLEGSSILRVNGEEYSRGLRFSRLVSSSRGRSLPTKCA